MPLIGDCSIRGAVIFAMSTLFSGGVAEAVFGDDGLRFVELLDEKTPSNEVNTKCSNNSASSRTNGGPLTMVILFRFFSSSTNGSNRRAYPPSPDAARMTF